MLPSSATMALRQDREPKRGTASPTRRIICSTQTSMPYCQPDRLCLWGPSDLSGILLGYCCSRTMQ
ncbi:hypothetical protein EYF80_034507 [Liparis tanakae]|uniref:Uncharacterized protein n=1 Tax=Liparis tanakae TaxID=230148 RepID=A0A4Z2GPM1_9TELE|nr:hypothetical protein EYF80_034507 [Liparis tanakae]